MYVQHSCHLSSLLWPCDNFSAPLGIQNTIRLCVGMQPMVTSRFRVDTLVYENC